MLEVRDDKQRVFDVLADRWQFDRQRHGSLYSRGGADSYYRRGASPHYGGVGGDSGPRVPVYDTESINEYLAGYDHNEKFGDRKEW
jgi:hypothetical protein